MLTVAKSIELRASAHKVWTLVGNFNAFPNYIEIVEKSDIGGEAHGVRRTLTLRDGSVLIEQLLGYDFEKMKLQYTLVDGALPVKDYLAIMKVEPAGVGCRFTWSGTFSAAGMTDEEAISVMGDVYQLGCDGLKNIFG